ncbi:acetyltransferase, gnat family [Indibacter alkaliphilus LW1]|jgi:ribosomal protein S18 acetylase RimI-like enzyme|uniref:Acetyltransferase, gnat family n=1 Tax=Indibacter alkaliphilus (strain CCUG 57479 / KCTC 22604 / LW1) TaxID=1189612 RepID=S2DKQ6_INDAL|nr:GNAT family N-acetyltransferase [Indibacter alkaliphilus]EOZ99674.1 acetyltransferase, gnat family [Indibacter alkaliphilus LW1]
MKSREIKIRNGSIEEVVALSQQVPEFFQPYSEKIYHERLSCRPHLILIAEVDGELAGFKVGYQSATSGIFYSWMGGVLASYRRMGIATKLADTQESWAKNHGFQKVQFKTRNRLSKMIHFGLNRGFMIVDLIKKDQVQEHRIVMEKNL